MKTIITQDLKDFYTGSQVKASIHGKDVIGTIYGRLLSNPFFKSLDGVVSFEISWPVAQRAVLGAKIIF